MKNLILLTLAIITLGSCNTLERKLESGQYDQAVVIAARKMAGDKNKKTKHVKVIEEAFAKVTARDLATARSYEDRGGKGYLLAIDVYDDIAARQSLILPFLPLVSKDGYVADFDFVRTRDHIVDAKKEAGKYYYAIGTSGLERARFGDKTVARRAHEDLKRAKYYGITLPTIDGMIDDAYNLGITHIFVNLRNEANVIMPRRFEDEILSVSVRDLNDKWKRFYLNPPGGQEIDVNATLLVNQIHVSPEREFIREFEETKEIKDGWKYKTGRDGKRLKDTLGNFIKVDKYRVVRAWVTEIKREKNARVDGMMRYTDARNGEVLRSKPISVTNNFGASMCTFNGDRRALTSHTLNRVNGMLRPFPTDKDMALLAAHEMKLALKGDLSVSGY